MKDFLSMNKYMMFFSVGIITLFTTYKAQAVQLKVGNTVIVDCIQQPCQNLDMNPNRDIIDVAFRDPVTGYNIQGTVTLRSGGALVELPGNQKVINFTEVLITNNGAKGGDLNIEFEETFNNPKAPVAAADGITGQWETLFGLNLLPGNSLKYQGFVNNIGIGNVFTSMPPGTPAINLPIKFNDADQIKNLQNGPPWNLRGELTVNLTAGTRLFLQDSSEVGIASVSEPTSIFSFLILGILGASFTLKRKLN